MNIFLICPVRIATPEVTAAVEAYVKGMEAAGYKVYWPARDTRQTEGATRICDSNRIAIQRADEVHVWWDAKSEGSIFDLGMAFSMLKPIRLANRPQVHRTPEKSFTNLLLDVARP